jgi:probable phosphoglycerate mutase
MRLILIRHGQTEHNRRGLTLGRADVPLTEVGRAQARAVAASFTSPPAAIYTSPLQRTADTAAAIGAASGTAIVIEQDLIEMDVGEMEHLESALLHERYPDFLRAWLSADVAEVRMPGGETLREVQDRAWGAIERIAAQHPDGDVVAVTHNFVMLTVACRALDLPIAEFRRMRIGLASRTVLDMRGGRPALISLNDTAHLAAAGLAGDA